MRRFTKVVLVYGLVLNFLLTGIAPAYAEQAAAGQTTPANGITSLFKDISPKDSNILVINYLANRKLLKGFPDKTFHPTARVTRAEAAVLLVRAAGLKTGEAKSRFNDVGPKYWAAGSINAAAAAGYLRGYPDGKFRPESMMTRAEGLSLFLRLSKQPDPGVELPPLADLNSKHWAARPVAIGLAAGMAGLTANKKQFLPDAPLTRSDMARVLGVLLVKDPALAQTTLANKLQVVKGTVKITRAGSQMTEAIKNSTALNAGDIIAIGPDGVAEVTFPDGTGLFLKENTELQVKETRGRSYIKSDGSPGTAVEWLALDLKQGKLFGALATSYETTSSKQEPEVKKASVDGLSGSSPVLPSGVFRILAAKDKTVTATDKKVANSQSVPWWQAQQTKRVRVKVDMPWGMAAIRGTFWENIVYPDGQFRTNLLTGEGEVNSGGQVVNMQAGQSTQVTGFQAPPAPPAPLTVQDKQEWVQTKEWAQQRAQEIQTNREPVIPPPPPVSLQLTQQPGQPQQPQQPQQPVVEQPQLPAVTFPDITSVINEALQSAAQGASEASNSSSGSSSSSVAVNGVTLDQNSLVLKAGGQPVALVANVFPDTASTRAVTWTSSNEAVVTVANGVVTPKAAGEAIITVRTVDGAFTETATVTVKDTWVEVTGVSLDKSSLILTAGGKPEILVAAVAPGNAANRAVTWSSSDKGVVTVSNGVVTPIASGTATITVTSIDGSRTATCIVTVNAQPPAQ